MIDKTQRIGHYLQASTVGERYHVYIPSPLPLEPPLQMEQLYSLLDQANLAVGRLDGIASLLPDAGLFLYFYIRREAVLSSQIEGTQSSLSDLLMYENEAMPGVPEQDVKEVSNYVAAMSYGLKRLKIDGFPLSLRLIRDIHKILLSDGRGSHKQPGEFRRSQNWIGGTRPGNAKFVPPSPEFLIKLLSDLEVFLHSETHTFPTLIKAALIHVQFETIHPFLDGNGRLGRLLITFLLCTEGLLDKPLLYLSLYFKTHRQAYYDHLQAVRETGDWEVWIKFFLQGIIETANQAISTAGAIKVLFEQDRDIIKSLGRSSLSVLAVQHALQKYLFSDINKVATYCQMSIPTVTKALNHLVIFGIVEEVTGKERHRIYVYKKYLDILNKGIGEL